MDLTLYNKIKNYKLEGKIPERSCFAQLRFKKHYNEDWTVKDDILYFQNKLIILKQHVNSILKEIY